MFNSGFHKFDLILLLYTSNWIFFINLLLCIELCIESLLSLTSVSNWIWKQNLWSCNEAKPNQWVCVMFFVWQRRFGIWQPIGGLYSFEKVNLLCAALSLWHFLLYFVMVTLDSTVSVLSSPLTLSLTTSVEYKSSGLQILPCYFKFLVPGIQFEVNLFIFTFLKELLCIIVDSTSNCCCPYGTCNTGSNFLNVAMLLELSFLSLGIIVYYYLTPHVESCDRKVLFHQREYFCNLQFKNKHRAMISLEFI